MVDIETYKKLHPSSKVSTARLRADLDAREMASNEPPKGKSLLLFPPHYCWVQYASKEVG